MSGLMEIVVPAGVHPGQSILVKAPTGQMLQVTVPPGVGPGGRFRIRVGTNAGQNQLAAAQQQQLAQQQQQQLYAQQQAQQEAQRQALIQQQLAKQRQLAAAPKVQKQVKITLPPGVRPGNTVTVNLPDGRSVKITVPPGTRPGATLTVNYDAPAPQSAPSPQLNAPPAPGAGAYGGTCKVKVVVPAGAVPGMKIRVSHDGYDYDVEVPQNVMPGQKFIAVLPTALAMQQRQIHMQLNAEAEKLKRERAMMSEEKERKAKEMIERSMRMQEEARAVFEKYDVNFDNAIDPAELLKLLQDSGFPQDVIEEELLAADSDGDHLISFDEFVIYYNHLQERLKAGAAETATAKAQMATQLAEMRNALLVQQQELAAKEKALFERNLALEQKEQSMARAQVEAHSGGGGGVQEISVEARVADIARQNDVAAAQLANDIQRKQENRKARLRQQLEAKKRARAQHQAMGVHQEAQMARQASCGQGTVTVTAVSMV